MEKKFIRVVNRIYEVESEYYDVIEHKVKGYFIGETELIRTDQITAEADAIEKIVDGFYIDDGGISSNNIYSKYDFTHFMFDFLNKYKDKEVRAYAFVKTYGGLKWVAELNKDGSLTLIPNVIAMMR